jgi:hypothetical protein
MSAGAFRGEAVRDAGARARSSLVIRVRDVRVARARSFTEALMAQSTSLHGPDAGALYLNEYYAVRAARCADRRLTRCAGARARR